MELVSMEGGRKVDVLLYFTFGLSTIGVITKSVA